VCEEVMWGGEGARVREVVGLREGKGVVERGQRAVVARGWRESGGVEG